MIFGKELGLWITFGKELFLLLLLFGIAWVDLKHHVILNQFLWIGLGIRLLFLVLEGVQGVLPAFFQIVIEFAEGGVIFGISYFFRFLSGGGIGMGDVKLFGLLPLFLGWHSSIRAIFYALWFLLAAACVGLLTKKKSRRDVLPFAPALLGGTCLLLFID